MKTAFTPQSSPPQGSKSPALLSESYVLQTMPQILTTRDLLCTLFIILFYITNVPNAVAYGASGITLWLLGAITFLAPCTIATVQLGVMFPHEGSVYNWTYQAFGAGFSFFAAFCFWVPSLLVILGTADLFVSYLQALHSDWLVEPWQQGLVLIGVIVFSAIVALQRHHTVQVLLNITTVLVLFVVVLTVVAGFAWLLKGHHAATSFQLRDWGITWDAKTGGSVAGFGLITLGYLGVNIPLNMAGELANRQKLSRQATIRHLLVGIPLMIVCYIVATWAVLVVQGQSAAFNLFSPVTTIDLALGKPLGDLAATCIMLTFIVTAATYFFVFARFLLVGGIDHRLPVSVARLSPVRVPRNAIIIQMGVVVILTALFFLITPYLLHLGKPADLANEIYFVAVGAATLLWAFATLFLFFNVLKLALVRKEAVLAARLFPPWLLITSAVIGTLFGLAAIVDTVIYSLTPLIPNSSWWYIVASVTAALVLVGIVTSFFATGEASWQYYYSGIEADKDARSSANFED